MRRLILVSLATAGVACSQMALAADIPPGPPPAAAPYYRPAPPPIFSWTGIYVGLNAGYGSANASATATVGAVSATASETLTGFVGGAQFGGLMQWGFGVFGFEADIQGSGQKKSSTILGVTLTDSIPWFTTYRARFGVAFDRILVYGTAGGAYGEFKSEVTGLGATLSSSQTRGAWTAGAGVEGAFAHNWTARLEYLYIDTGNINAFTAGPIVVTTRVQDHIVRGAINFRFGPW